MSSEDVWYFVRGEEQVGPFSKDLIRQIHEGGQLSPETLVWREGMSGWEPAGSIPELEISNQPLPPPPPPPTTPSESKVVSFGKPAPSPEGHRQKLKLKDNTLASAPTLTAPVIEPLPPPPQAPPALLPPVNSVVARAIPPSEEPFKEDPAAKAPLIEEDEDKGPSFLKRVSDKIFSSLLLTPLYLIAVGVMILYFESSIPSVYWFKWMVLGFSIFGVLSLVGVHGFDQLFRLLALLLLAPPIAILWPVIMGEIPWQQTPPAHLTFLGLAFLYCLTTRIGLRVYMSSFLGKFAGLTGIATLALIGVIGAKTWSPQGWENLVARKADPRLPARVALVIGKPEWGTGNGYLRFKENRIETEHPIASAILKRLDPKEVRLVLKTMDDLLFVVKIPAEGKTLDPKKICNQPWPIYFSKESADDPTSVTPQWTLANGSKADISTASFTITRITNEDWEGHIILQLNGIENPVSGAFFARVTTLSE